MTREEARYKANHLRKVHPSICIDAEDFWETVIAALEQEPKTDVLDKIKGYIDHIRSTGMGKEKSLEFIEKFIDGLKAESEEV